MKVIAFSGSTRRESLNRRLLARAVEAARAAGVAVEEVDLRALDIPLYDGDLEAERGRPAGAEKLRSLVLGANGLLVASPEYNAGVPAVLKNALDWVSRPPAPQAFAGKVVALFGASPGPSGTMRMQPHLRASLVNLGAWTLPSSVTIPFAERVIAADGAITDAKVTAQIAKVIAELVDELRRRG